MFSAFCNRKGIFYGYVIVAALWFIYFFNLVIPTYGASVLNATMAADTNMSSSVMGLAVALCTLTQGLMGPFLGKLVQRFGNRRTLIIGTACMGAGAFLLALFGGNVFTFFLFYGVIMGAGLGTGGMIVINSSVNLWFDRRKGLALALVISAGGIGGFIIPTLLSSLAMENGWRSGWLLYAVFCVLSILFSLFFLIDTPAAIGEAPDGKRYQEKHPIETTASVEGAQKKKDPPLAAVLKSAQYYLLLVCSGAKFALYYAITAHVVLFLTQEGMSAESAATAIGYFSLASMLGRLLVGFVSEKILTPRMNTCGSTILMGAAVIIMVLMPQSIAVVYLCMAVAGFALGMSFIGGPVMIAREFGDSNFVAINGNLAPVTCVLGAVGPALAGIVADTFGSYVVAYLIFSVFAIITSILLYISKPVKFED